MRALVVHPRLSVLAGGEFVCLNVVQACKEVGWDVTLLSDRVELDTIESVYGASSFLQGVQWLTLPEFEPVFSRFRALQAVTYGRSLMRFLKDLVRERGKPDVIFSTQSSILQVPGVPSYHFCYESPKDLFTYPLVFHRKKGYFPYDMIMRGVVRLLFGPKPVPTKILVNSSLVGATLREAGYEVLSYYPPMQSIFKPAPKEDTVFMAARFDRRKRIEWFLEMAGLLPNYKFILVCRSGTNSSRYFDEDYSENVLRSLPKNVEYVNSPLRPVAQLLAKSKVCVYTGNEPGVALTMIEGISGGCVPIAPSGTGNGQIIEKLGIGYTYRSPKEGADCIKEALNSRFDPETISSRAREFHPEVFRKRIHHLLENE